MNSVGLVKNDRDFSFSIDRDFLNYAFEFIAFLDIERLNNGFGKCYLVSHILFSMLLSNPGLNFDTWQFFHQDFCYRNQYKNTTTYFDNEIDNEKFIRHSVQKYISKEV